MNSHHFDDVIVKSVFETCVAAGIDYMEIGYRASRKGVRTGEHGCWKYCLEEDIRRIVGDNPTPLKISIMADAGKCDYREDIPKKESSIVDLIRVACYLHQIPLALDMVQDAHDKGYETTINLMAVTTAEERELDAGLEMLASSEAGVIYLVDSFGALTPRHTVHLARKYLNYAAFGGKEVGMHAHNNLLLAFSNTVEAASLGVNYLDATMAGLGRGAGNCPMELLLGFLDNTRYRLHPVLQCVDEVIEPMRKDLKWGFDLPYMITGLFNHHPRAAIAFNATNSRGDIREFYDAAVHGEG